MAALSLFPTANISPIRPLGGRKHVVSPRFFLCYIPGLAELPHEQFPPAPEREIQHSQGRVLVCPTQTLSLGLDTLTIRGASIGLAELSPRSARDHTVWKDSVPRIR